MAEGKTKIMGYEMPIVCKEVYIPISKYDFNITLQDYKDKYGIDLSNYLSLEDSGEIKIILPNFTKFYIISKDLEFSALFGRILFANGYDTNSVYSEGSSDAETIFGVYDDNEESYIGLIFIISKDDDYKIENVKVSMCYL